MLTRSELRQLMTAARKGWDTAAKRRQQAVRDVQEVLANTDAPDYLRSTARQCLAVLSEAGWTTAHAPT